MTDERNGPEETFHDTERKLRERIEWLERERVLDAKLLADTQALLDTALEAVIDAKLVAEAKLAEVEAERDATTRLLAAAGDGLRLMARAEAAEAKLAEVEAERDAAIAALPAVSAQGVRVKPLVWFEVARGNNGYGKWTAEGYTVRKIEGMFLLDFAGDSKSDWLFPTVEAAKAAAQADYAVRIIAALELAELAGVNAAVDALVKAAEVCVNTFRSTEHEELRAALAAIREGLNG